MRAFADLLDRLASAPRRDARLRLIAAYLARTPDPDRGYGLAALAGGLDIPNARRGLVRELVAGRVDPVLLEMSRDYVGDLAETVALVWPAAGGEAPGLGAVVETLAGAGRDEVAGLVAGWLDALDPSARVALVKLVSGGLKSGVSPGLARQAVADFAGHDVARIEELWHGLSPPYLDLFAWAEGRAREPDVSAALRFHPLMLAHPLADGDLARLDPADYLAEWKWDGIRVQVVARGGEGRLFSRAGDDVTAQFPDIAGRLAFDAVLDGELLVVRDGTVAPFADLAQRLGRKTASARMLREHPAHIRLYDALMIAGEDLRARPLAERRARLEAWHDAVRPAAMDLSPLLPFADFDALAALREAAPVPGVEGLMLKRRDAPYLAGRPEGLWLKWKRAPLVVDAVLVYAQRGSGERASFYSELTFAAWRERDGASELVPVGKAHFDSTDDELLRLDRFVRRHTVSRFGPVREVEPRLVFEVAFDAVDRAPRRKAGLALRFPRIDRVRWDKPAEEADRLETLQAMIVG